MRSTLTDQWEAEPCAAKCFRLCRDGRVGSTLATVVLSNSVAWAGGALAVALLAALHFMVAEASVHVSWFRRAATSAPTLLLRDGQPDCTALREERISERACVR